MPGASPQRFLLDTNIVIALFAQEAAVLQPLSQAAEVFLPSIVLGELYYGAEKSARAEANVQRVNELAARSAILVCDTDTAHSYGQIKNQLRAQGKPLPENDIWVAAFALQHDLALVSRDAHFHEVAGISVVAW